MSSFSLREFIVTQHGVPWKLRLAARRLIPWQLRRVLFYGRVNLNTPEAMDARYLHQGDDFRSMENLYAHIIRKLPRRGRLLDAGCGIAVLLRMIRDEQAGLELHGMDFSFVAVSRTRDYGFPSVRARLPELPYADASFDCVVSTEVLEHLDRPEQALRSFHRVLRPGGLLIVSVPEGMGPDDCMEHIQDFDERSLHACLTSASFEVESIDLVEREPARKPGASYLAVARRA